ncbi:MAG: glycosyltransferase [Planctomycetes bacterium]|nr:glycosyltransferase [Planctomycetota bacterium]
MNIVRFILDVHEIGGAVLDVDILDRTLARRRPITIHKLFMTSREACGWTEVVGSSTISYHPIHYRLDSIQQDREMLVARIRSTLASIVDAHDIDLVANHVPEIASGVLVSRIVKEMGLPLFIQFHGGDIPRMRFSGEHQLMVDTVVRNLNESARLADAVSAVSESAGKVFKVKSHLNLWTGADAEFYDPARIQPGFLRDRLDLSADVPIVVLPARIVLEKGHKILLDAARVLADRNVPFNLVFVGSAREDIKRQLDACVMEYGLSGMVHTVLNATQHEMRYIYRDSDIVTLPGYHFEGCPRCLLEAQLMEKPVVASDSGGTRESFRDHETGLLFPVGDVGRLAATLETLLLNPELRERFGKAGRKFVKDRFDLESLAARHERVYLDLLRRPAAVVA